MLIGTQRAWIDAFFRYQKCLLLAVRMDRKIWTKDTYKKFLIERGITSIQIFHHRTDLDIRNWSPQLVTAKIIRFIVFNERISHGTETSRSWIKVLARVYRIILLFSRGNNLSIIIRRISFFSSSSSSSSSSNFFSQFSSDTKLRISRRK